MEDVTALAAPTDTADSPAAPPRRRRRFALAAAALAGVIVLGGVGLIASQLSTDPTLVRSPLVGKPAPTFELTSVDGGTVRSSDFAGRPYVINFWATWCPACRKEHPYLMSFYQRWAPRGVGMVGIVYNDTRSKIRAYRAEMITRMGEAYPDVMDPGGRAALDYGVYGVPETFVVDGDGIVVAKFIGAIGPNTLDRVLRRVG